MYRGNSSRIFPIILVLIVIAIVVAALVSLGRAFLGGDQPTEDTNVGRDALLNTSVGHSVRMTVRGPIVANEEFHSYQITIGPSSRQMTTYRGYLEDTLRSKGYGNNHKAYEQFVYALDKANYMNGAELEGDKNDTRGICATGRVFEFEVLSSGESVKRLWTSTCKGSPGSLKASVTQVTNLFQAQIPASDDLLKGLNLSSGSGFSL